MLYGEKGEQISVAAINFHDRTFDAVEGYQFVQSEPGRCVLYIVPAADRLSEKECQQIAESVASKLAPTVVCEIRQCRELVLTQRGKYKMVVQNCVIESEIPVGDTT